jgi:hypothetical protein
MCAMRTLKCEFNTVLSKRVRRGWDFERLSDGMEFICSLPLGRALLLRPQVLREQRGLFSAGKKKAKAKELNNQGKMSR